MAEDRSRGEILDLLARGKISVDQAADMLNAVSAGEPVYKVDSETEPVVAPENEPAKEAATAPADEVAAPPVEKAVEIPVWEEEERAKPSKSGGSGEGPRWLRIAVRNLETGRDKVLVNIPFGMVRFGLSMASRMHPELRNFDLDELNRATAAESEHVLVDVHDEDSGERVQIYLD